jgi:hypothetical protein
VGGAVATTAAVVVALWLGWRDRRWRREEQADRDAAQARLITADPEIDMVGGGVDYTIIIRILNGSPSPVFDVKVVGLRNDERPDLDWRVDTDPRVFGDGFPTEPRVIAAGQRFSLPVEYVDPETKASTYPPGADHVTIEFTDAHGLRWRRRDGEPPARLLTDEQVGASTRRTGTT